MCADKFLKLHALMFGWPKSALIPRKWCGFRCISWSPLSFCGFNIWGVSIHVYFWLYLHPHCLHYKNEYNKRGLLSKLYIHRYSVIICLCIFADWKVLALHCGKDIYSVLYHIKPQKVRETAELYWNIASRILRNSCSISPVYRNIMIGTKALPVSSISLKILLRMLKNRWKWQKMPNWPKIPREHFLKGHHRVASTRKPYGRKKNFAFISHRKKVRWTSYELWPLSWILLNSERCHMIWALGPSFY